MGPAFGQEPSPPAGTSANDVARADADGANRPSIDREGSLVALRLAIGRDGLGLELSESAHVACLTLTELVVRLPRVRFPFDVSGGVAKFRHKRGELERLAIEVDARRFSAWAEPRLRGLVGIGTCHVAIEGRRLGATITVDARMDATGRAPEAASDRHAAHVVHGARRVGARRVGVAALVFDVELAPTGDDLVVVVHGARGANLHAAPTKLALDAMTELLRGVARREGARFVLNQPAARLVRHLLPEAGVRAPSGDDVRLTGAGFSDGVWLLAFARGGTPVEIADATTRALEAALLLRTADDARMTEAPDRARARDLEALERAPRHPEIVRRIVETDALATGRAEAALATLREAKGAVRTGLLAGMLELEANEPAAAVAEFVREGERETSNVLGALAYAAAASVTSDRRDALVWLDRAVARAPLLAELRWDRAKLRLEEGRLDGARADLQELEAAASGSRERLEVVRRGAELYRSVGLGDAAATLYERALRYAPDDPAALFGLGAALAKEGRAARGAALVARAIELASQRLDVTFAMDLELARILAVQLGDLPAAIARVRGIPDAAPEAIEARGFEGRWRAELGDVAGASLAFARLRTRGAGETAAVGWLVEAARFEASRGDPFAAHRHAEAALSADPKNPELLSLYRTLGEKVAEASGMHAPKIADRSGLAPQTPTTPTDDDAKTLAPAPLHAEPILLTPEKPAPALAAAELDEAAAEQRVESLTRAVQADPTNDDAVDELVSLLTHLGRSMELFALLSARLEEAPAERRAALLPRHREVLETLERHARDEGRVEEAELFKLARESAS